jgi:hypothetical protein
MENKRYEMLVKKIEKMTADVEKMTAKEDMTTVQNDHVMYLADMLNQTLHDFCIND